MCVEKGSWGTHSFKAYQEGRPTQCLFFLQFHDVTQVASIHNKMALKMAIINNNSLILLYFWPIIEEMKNIYNLNPQNLAIKEAQNQRFLALFLFSKICQKKQKDAQLPHHVEKARLYLGI